MSDNDDSFELVHTADDDELEAAVPRMRAREEGRQQPTRSPRRRIRPYAAEVNEPAKVSGGVVAQRFYQNPKGVRFEAKLPQRSRQQSRSGRADEAHNPPAGAFERFAAASGASRIPVGNTRFERVEEEEEEEDIAARQYAASGIASSSAGVDSAEGELDEEGFDVADEEYDIEDFGQEGEADDTRLIGGSSKSRRASANPLRKDRLRNAILGLAGGRRSAAGSSGEFTSIRSEYNEHDSRNPYPRSPASVASPVRIDYVPSIHDWGNRHLTVNLREEAKWFVKQREQQLREAEQEQLEAAQEPGSFEYKQDLMDTISKRRRELQRSRDKLSKLEKELEDPDVKAANEKYFQACKNLRLSPEREDWLRWDHSGPYYTKARRAYNALLKAQEKYKQSQLVYKK
jgi:hypothetical protein